MSSGDPIREADTLEYQNILLPTGWIAGQDALAFAAAALRPNSLETYVPPTR